MNHPCWSVPSMQPLISYLILLSRNEVRGGRGGKWGRGEWRPVKHEWGTDVALAQHRRAEFPSLKYKRWFADEKSHTLAGRACSLGRDVWGLKKKKLAAIHNKFCIYMCNLCSSTCVIPFPSTTLSTKHITKKKQMVYNDKRGKSFKVTYICESAACQASPPTLVLLRG